MTALFTLASCKMGHSLKTLYNDALDTYSKGPALVCRNTTPKTLVTKNCCGICKTVVD